MLTLNVTPVDALLFQSDIVAVGSFRCDADHPLFRRPGPIGNPLFAFPRTVASIRLEDGTEFVGDPNTVTLYNRSQVYSRERVSDRHDVDWYAVTDDVLLDAIAERDPHILDRPDRPFVTHYVPSDSALYFEQRRLFELLSGNPQPDRLGVEEAIVGLLDRVIGRVYQRQAAPNQAPRRKMRDSVEAARLAIASDMSRNITLRELAALSGCSPFALCREFHAAFGVTATEYRQSLRLRSALGMLWGSADLTTIALDLGYSSHSHFTNAFRRQFGVTPSDYRFSATGRKVVRASSWRS